MDLLRVVVVAVLAFLSLGCQLSYYLHSAYHQTKLVQSRKPIAKVLAGDKLSAEQKAKLELVLAAKKFAEGTLGLAPSSNYTTYVQLEEPYVTYIVQAAYPFELKPFQWHFPLVGDVPYKGYFRKALAEEEARRLAGRDFDTYLRGVSAYSTLGWFQDSVLSSMLRYDDFDLVETIIHETVHTTLFIKDAAEFNERMATFLGHQGMILFYRALGEDGETELEMAEEDGRDQKLFSAFLTREVESLKAWYKEHASAVTPDMKRARLAEIQDRFKREVRPKLQPRAYEDFEKRELNNAVLLAYRTYEYSLEDFEKLHRHFGGDYVKTLEWLKGLKNERNPEEKLKAFVAGLK